MSTPNRTAVVLVLGFLFGVAIVTGCSGANGDVPAEAGAAPVDPASCVDAGATE